MLLFHVNQLQTEFASSTNLAPHRSQQYIFHSLQVEVVIAISSVTSPLLFSASGFLSCSVISFIEIFLHDVPTGKVSGAKWVEPV